MVARMTPRNGWRRRLLTLGGLGALVGLARQAAPAGASHDATTQATPTNVMHLGALQNQSAAPTGLLGSHTNAVLTVINQSSAPSASAHGISGVSEAAGAAGVAGSSQAFQGKGVFGRATYFSGGMGVYGVGERGSFGVVGEGLGPAAVGVRAVNTGGGRAATVQGSGSVEAMLIDSGGTGNGVVSQAWSDTNAGLFGRNLRAGPGVVGQSGINPTGSGIGVLGRSGSGAGVRGESASSNGVAGANTNGNTYAGMFVGHASDPNDNSAPGIYIKGTMVATGMKSAAVKTKKGLTLLYAVEAPEALFEDVGTARLVKGKARVDLDSVFAETIQTDRYQVFLTPVSTEAKGLTVATKDARGFSIQEIGGGTGDYAFDWRVIARRKDAPAGHRLATVAQPNLPTAPNPVSAPVESEPATGSR